MDLEILIAKIICVILLSGVAIYFWHRLQNKKIDFKSHNFYIALLFAILTGTLINLFVPHYLRIASTLLTLSLINYMFFCKSVDKSFIIVFIYELFIMMSETIFVLMVTPFYTNVAELQTNPIGILIINFSILLIMLIFLKTILPYKVYNSIMKLVEEMRKRRLFLIIVLTILLASLLMVMSWIKLPSPLIILT